MSQITLHEAEKKNSQHKPVGKNRNKVLTLYSLGSEETLDCLDPKGLGVIAVERRDEPSDLRNPRGSVAEPDHDTPRVKYLEFPAACWLVCCSKAGSQDVFWFSFWASPPSWLTASGENGGTFGSALTGRSTWLVVVAQTPLLPDDFIGCKVVTKVEIWFGKTVSCWPISDGGAGLPWVFTGVWELKGQSREGVVALAPSEAKEAKWVSSPKLLPSEAGMAPSELPWGESTNAFIKNELYAHRNPQANTAKTEDYLPGCVLSYGIQVQLWGWKAPLWRSCGSAELGCVAAGQSWMVLMKERWSKDGGQGGSCAVTAGLWGNGQVREDWLLCRITLWYGRVSSSSYRHNDWLMLEFGSL